MKEPQGFIGASDYIDAVIQPDGFYLLAFITPGIEDHYQFTIRHNIPHNAMSSAAFNIIGHLYNRSAEAEASATETSIEETP